MMRASIQVTAIANAITVPSAAIRVAVEGSAITKPIATTAMTISAAKIASSGNSGAGWGSAGGEERAAMSGSCRVVRGLWSERTPGAAAGHRWPAAEQLRETRSRSDAVRLVGGEVAGDAAVGDLPRRGPQRPRACGARYRRDGRVAQVARRAARE